MSTWLVFLSPPWPTEPRQLKRLQYPTMQGLLELSSFGMSFPVSLQPSGSPSHPRPTPYSLLALGIPSPLFFLPTSLPGHSLDPGPPLSRDKKTPCRYLPWDRKAPAIAKWVGMFCLVGDSPCSVPFRPLLACTWLAGQAAPWAREIWAQTLIFGGGDSQGIASTRVAYFNVHKCLKMWICCPHFACLLREISVCNMQNSKELPLRCKVWLGPQKPGLNTQEHSQTLVDRRHVFPAEKTNTGIFQSSRTCLREPQIIGRNGSFLPSFLLGILVQEQ